MTPCGPSLWLAPSEAITASMSSDASSRKGTSVSDAPSSLASSAYSWISKAISTLLPVVTTVPEAGQPSSAAVASLKDPAWRSV